MTLEFPNRSRSFDEVRNAVRFMGHDGMFEVPFFVEADALATCSIANPSGADCLSAFDAARSSIHDVAREAYSHGRRSAYTLTAGDFRERLGARHHVFDGVMRSARSPLRITATSIAFWRRAP